MFTGIVTRRARVLSAETAPGGGLRLRVRLSRAVEGLRAGDSLAVDGVCLTATTCERGPGADPCDVGFDVVPETLRKTTLGDLQAGSGVNLEPALRVGDPLGGHLVQGHVDGVGRVLEVERRGDDVRMTISVPRALRGATIVKGSITVDGVSLTVGESEDDRFSVYLVPHTLAVTGLGEKSPGARVNLEADVVGRWVEHHVRRALSESPAREAGR
jgi:riboflavin synthase alpha subunit